MTEVELRINRADDSQIRDIVEIKILSETYYAEAHSNIDWHNYRQNSTNPIFSATKDYFKRNLVKRRRSSRYHSRHSPSFKSNPDSSDFNVQLTISGMPISIEKNKGRININGHFTTLDTVCGALAKLTIMSINEKNIMKLFSALNEYLDTPENIHYVLENKVPYHFYERNGRYNKIEVRLNVNQIGLDTYALELSDGIWGEISKDDLNTFCNTYRHGHSRGSWKDLKPADLFVRLMGRTPSEAEIKLMKEFLQQNRTGDIVEKRAQQLLKETLEKYKKRIVAVHDDDGDIIHIYVRGKLYDWKISDRRTTSDLQKVSVQIWQPAQVRAYDGSNKPIINPETDSQYSLLSAPDWRGPICIDNLATGSSLGDQFVARILCTMNDEMLLKLVHTIQNYIYSKADAKYNKNEEITRLLGENNNEM